MGRIVVFDSGLGSLSIIGPIRRLVRSDVVYFADQRNFPYGLKDRTSLREIITDRISMLEKRFCPDVIVVGSNTPTLLLADLFGGRIVGVRPPLARAVRASRTGRIAVLATKSVADSAELARFIRSSLPDGIRAFVVNASPLVELVESGTFMDDPAECARAVRRELEPAITANRIDAATLSSTHLPFLSGYLRAAFPSVRFLDPAVDVARSVARMVGAGSANGSLRIYTSSDPAALRRRLLRMGLRGKVSYLR